jgi:hypothetical protein
VRWNIYTSIWTARELSKLEGIYVVRGLNFRLMDQPVLIDRKEAG